MENLRFSHTDLPPDAEALRTEVRAFLAEELAETAPVDKAKSWSCFDAGFSRKLGQQGWLGLTWPKQYGGHERSALERYVLLEELLAAGAPVAAHWIADRQSGPLMLRYGSETQRQKYLPAIAAGEAFFCIGMSEPDSGSDLASIRTKARRTNSGWVINGRKVWTTNAHRVQYMIALVRTEGSADDRHAGLSQFVIDLKAPGITIRPIKDLSGAEEFNEVTFEDVAVDDDALVGTPGGGWKQVVAELAFERSGPERYLSSYQLLYQMIDRAAESPEAAAQIGRQVARLVTLRQMSVAVAGMLDRGEDTGLQAAVVKDLGVTFEQQLPHIAVPLMSLEPAIGGGDDLAEVMALLTQIAPSFSLRGGTREIMRGIIARGLGLR